MNWKEQFDKQPFIVKQYEPDAHATEYHLLDMPNEVIYFISTEIIEKLIEDMEHSVLGKSYSNAEDWSRHIADDVLKIRKQLRDKWLKN